MRFLPHRLFVAISYIAIPNDYPNMTNGSFKQYLHSEQYMMNEAFRHPLN